MTGFRHNKHDRDREGETSVVMTKVEEIVVKARINNHIPIIMTPTNLITRSPVKAMEREAHSLPKGMDATYMVGRMTTQDALN